MPNLGDKDEKSEEFKSMTSKRFDEYRRVLEAMDGRVRGDIQSLEELARTGLGGDAGGSLSNAPMHLADLGSEQYMQELNATLFENEEYIRLEVLEAIGRLDRAPSAFASDAVARSWKSGSKCSPILGIAPPARPRSPTARR